MPVVAVSKLARSFHHLVLAPGHLFLRDVDQLFGRVGDHLVGQLDHERFAAYWIADDVTRVARPCTCGTRRSGPLSPIRSSSPSLTTRPRIGNRSWAAFRSHPNNFLAQERCVSYKRLI